MAQNRLRHLPTIRRESWYIWQLAFGVRPEQLVYPLVKAKGKGAGTVGRVVVSNGRLQRLSATVVRATPGG